jgi:integrase
VSIEPIHLLDVCALSEQLNLPPTWIYEQARRGRIPAIKLGRYWRFDPNSTVFQHWLDSLRTGHYDSATEQKEGPETEDHEMARSSYQQGYIKWRRNKRGKFAVLCYNLRSGDTWIHKTETLLTNKGELCRSTKEAERARAARMLEVNHMNSKPRARSITLAEFIDGLWQTYIEEKIKASTAYSYQSMLKTYVIPAWGHRLIDSIVPQDITLFFDARRKERLSDKYRLNLYGLLNVLFEVATQYDLIESNPVRRKLHRPAVERAEKPVLSAAQLRDVIAHFPGEHQPLALCVAITGLRLGELLALRWCNVDFAGRRLSITHNLWRGRLVSPKTEASKRTLHLPDALAGILQAHRSRSEWDKPEDFIFCTGQGGPLDPDHLRKCVLYPALKAVGIEPGDRTHGFHMFRHSAATIVHAQTRDKALAGDLLGHSEESFITSKYIHTDRAAEQATELLAREIAAGERSIN